MCDLVNVEERARDRPTTSSEFVDDDDEAFGQRTKTQHTNHRSLDKSSGVMSRSTSVSDFKYEICLIGYGEVNSPMKDNLASFCFSSVFFHFHESGATIANFQSHFNSSGSGLTRKKKKKCKAQRMNNSAQLMSCCCSHSLAPLIRVSVQFAAPRSNYRK